MERRGFTLRELLVVLAVVALLAALLIPILVSAREKSRSTTCLSNVGQLSKATLLYISVNEDRFPPNQWQLAIGLSTITKTKRSRVPGSEIVYTKPTLICPDYRAPLLLDAFDGSGGYGMNFCLTKTQVPDAPSQIVMVGETAVYESILLLNGRHYQAGHDYIEEPDYLDVASSLRDPRIRLVGPLGAWGAVRHLGRGNYAFVDGHAGAIAPEAFYIPRGMPCGEIERPDDLSPNRARFASLPFGTSGVGYRQPRGL